jgi:hypothetical protein
VRRHNRWRGLFQGIGDAIITVTQAGDDRYNSGSTTTTLTVNSVSVLTKTEKFLLLTQVM